MKKSRLELIKRLFRIASLGPVAPLLGTWGSSKRFPTRTIELDTFSFDPSTGIVTNKTNQKAELYKFILDGLVDSPVSLTYEELRALPRTSQTSDFHCVEGWTIPEVTWGGVKITELLKLTKVKDEAKYAVFHSLGQTGSAPGGQSWYIESVRISDLLDSGQDFLLALDIDGKPLSHDRGAPARLVTPYLLAYKSIKFVYRMELSSRLQEGWWTLANPIYDWEAKVPVGRLRKH